MKQKDVYVIFFSKRRFKSGGIEETTRRPYLASFSLFGHAHIGFEDLETAEDHLQYCSVENTVVNHYKYFNTSMF